MSSGTLYTYSDNFRAYKILIAAKYSGADVSVDKNFVFGKTNKSPEFLKKFPLGKVPAFETKDGRYITESNAIAYYVANDQLRGNSVFEKARIIQWLDFADGIVLPSVTKWLFNALELVSQDKQVVETAKKELKATLNFLDKDLLTKTYLVGERITLADIVLACTLLKAYSDLLEPSFRKPYVNVNRWFATIVNQSAVKSVIGEFKFCEKTVEVDPSKQEKKDKKKEEKKKEKTPAKKEKTATKEDGEPEELDATEEALAAEPKSKDPFEVLPKGTFNMDDFKRFYSNEDEAKSIPYFWEKFDKENYSIWYGKYKYNNELQKVFMSCNLITGMFQRLDKMRKQAFASVCLFGPDGNSSISGVWVWRGQELAFELSPDWKTDYDVYEWTKLDPDSEKTKQLVEQYFSWKGTDEEGRKFNQGKIFK